MKWKPYDPTWLIELVKEQYPDKPWLVDALAACTSYAEESKAYYYFVDSTNPNRPGSVWQYEYTLLLEHRKEGTLILDILTDHRVGGVEFLKKL